MYHPPRPTETHRAAMALVFCASLLAGCGGGSGSGDAAAGGGATAASALTDIPATATQSLAGLLDYQKAIGATASDAQDRAEPLDVGALVLPTSETAEPTDV